MKKKNLKSAIPRFDEYASIYDEDIKRNGYIEIKNTKKWLAPHLGKVGRLLDIGIGSGVASEPFAKNGWEVVGIDGSTKMLELVQSKAFCTQLIKADFSSGYLPYHGAPFDLFLCAGALEFVVDLTSFASELRRLSNPLGLTIATLVLRDITLNPHFTKMEFGNLSIDKYAFEKTNLVAVHYDADDVENALGRVGFSLVDKERQFVYRSSTQGIITRCRLMIFKRG